MPRYFKPLIFALALVMGAYSVTSAQMRVDGIPAILKIVTRLLLPDGTEAAPSLAQSSDQGNGLSFGSDVIVFSTNGVKRWTIGNSSLAANGGMNIVLGSGSTLQMSSRWQMFSGVDGEVDVTNTAASENAGVRIRYLVEANTGTKSPSSSESREVYTNTGDADGSIINLPDDPTAGLSYLVGVTAAQTITINTGTGETIWLAGTSCGTDIAGSDTGASLLIIAMAGGSGGIWHAIGSGTWTC